MTHLNVLSRLSIIVVFFYMAGCANDEQQNRMLMLEDQNKSLEQALAQANRSLEALDMDQQDLMADRNRLRDLYSQQQGTCEQQLAALQMSNQQLQDQLNAMPEPNMVAEGWTEVGGGAMISIKGSVLFDPGNHKLRDDAVKVLDSVASAISADYSTMDILVVGHTDDQPIKKSGWEDNYQLSTERALSVVRYLAGRGIAAERLVASGCGMYRPKAPNTSKANRDANRRVQIFAVELDALSGG